MSATRLHIFEANAADLRRQFLTYSVAAIVLLMVWPSRAWAQDGHSRRATVQNAQLTADLRNGQTALVRIVTESTARFQDVGEALYEGYALQFGCVSGDNAETMVYHFVNRYLMGQGIVDATHPQIVIYEPTPSGSLELIGADYLVLADQWNADRKHKGPPELMGQMFHLFDSANSFGLPAAYTLHVPAQKENPDDALASWYPNESCEQFTEQPWR